MKFIRWKKKEIISGCEVPDDTDEMFKQVCRELDMKPSVVTQFLKAGFVAGFEAVECDDEEDY